MPSTRTHVDEFDYDVASLRDPLPAEALDALGSILDARDAVNDFANLLRHAQTRLEAGTLDEVTRGQLGDDLRDLHAAIGAATVRVFG